MKHHFIMSLLLTAAWPAASCALEYPGTPPGKAQGTVANGKTGLDSVFVDDASGLVLHWSATLDDGANAIIQTLRITASRDTRIEELVFIDTPLDGARQVGQVDGSVVVCGDLFMAVEHPLAKNTVGGKTQVRCALPRGNVLKSGGSWTHTSVFGAVPPGQLRRGFLYYLEHRRAHPYRPFLHYNNWYNVWLGPLYPLNSLMLHGPCIGDRRNPANMVRTEKSIADEFWSFFGSGTCLQELYINPTLLTETMWDQLAAAAKWSRANRGVLVDTHWIGGDPGKAEVYGWASWQPGKGIMVLRNPSDKPQEFSITPRTALELPGTVTQSLSLKLIYPQGRQLPAGTPELDQAVKLILQPFEVIVMELVPQTNRPPKKH